MIKIFPRGIFQLPPRFTGYWFLFRSLGLINRKTIHKFKQSVLCKFMIMLSFQFFFAFSKKWAHVGLPEESKHSVRLLYTLFQIVTKKEIKLQPEACNFIKNRLKQVFSCGFCKIFKNIFFLEHICWLLLTGFRKNHSTQNALLVMIEKWRAILNKNSRSMLFLWICQKRLIP